jgi:Na+/proline symporter
MNGAAVFLSFLSLFAALSWALSWAFSKPFSGSKSAVLVANRKLGVWESSLSVAASWIWAPALFISSQKAYQDGFIGLFWFVTPNVLCLVVFAYAATRVRKEFPQGFSLSQYIHEKTSDRVQNLYWFGLGGLAVCAFAVQLLAGGQFLSELTGIPFFWLTLILSAIPLSYSLVFGLKATVITDYAKMIFIYVIGLTLIPWAVSEGGTEALVRGLGGQNHITDIFGADSLRIFLTFGLPTTIGCTTFTYFCVLTDFCHSN